MNPKTSGWAFLFWFGCLIGFAMAAAVFEAVEAGDPAWARLPITVEPGITAMLAAAARAGAPLGGDFCALSLSDNLKPWAVVEARLEAVLRADLGGRVEVVVSTHRTDPWTCRAGQEEGGGRHAAG